MSASRVLSFLFFCFLCFSVDAQFTDDFSDGNFTSNPTWVGETGFFRVAPYNNNPLQSQGPGATDTLHLATANTSINGTEWEFLVRLKFAPSASNRLRVYLVSDQSDLEGPLNGYFLEVGETSTDSLRFFLQSGTTITPIGVGSKTCFTSSDNTVRFKVNRDNAGNWTIESDCSGGSTFTSDGNFTENTHTSTSYFGVWCRHTSSRDTLFYFDDIAVGPPTVDITPPTIQSLTAISNTEVDVLFSEDVDLTTAQTASNYAGNGGLGAPTSAIRDAGNNALVHLTFATAFTSAQQYTLTINNVQDLAPAPNTILANSTGTFTWFAVVTAQYKDVIMTEIMADPSPAPACVPAVEYLELHNRTATAINLLGWEISETSTALTSHILPANGYVVLVDDNDTLQFAGATFDWIPVVSLSLTNGGEVLTLHDDNGVLIDSVEYSDDWYDPDSTSSGGYSLELINPLDTCSILGNWITSTDPCGGTPGVQNSVYNATPDVTAPVLTATTVTSATEVQLCFDETLDSASAVLLGNYSLASSGGNPTQAILSGAGQNCVNLTFGAPGLSVGTLDSVIISGVADCKGNASGLQYAEVLLPATANALEVRINEIYADPTPSNPGTPPGHRTEEYIELFNLTSNYFNLKDWTYNVNGTVITLDDFILGPNGYVILCDVNDVSMFSPFGDVLPVNGFPSLTNSGAPLSLYNNQGTRIDTVFYDDSWYQNDTLDGGGWSLELINPFENCKLLWHWIASSDPMGGTPGTQNAEYDPNPDTTPPSLLSVTVFQPDTLLLCFDETLDPASATNVLNYQVTNFGPPTSATLLPPGNDCVQLVFGGTFTAGIAYEVVVDNVADCGLTSMASPVTETFGSGANADPNEIVINEVFADPTPPLAIGLPEDKFVELYNNSSRVLDLTDATLVDAAGNVGRFPDDPTTINAGEYVILVSSSNLGQYSIYGREIVITSFPDPNVSGDELYLYDADGELLDAMFYDEDTYGDEDKADGGWTLERVDPSFSCANSGNWRASESSNGGTPGAVNSVAGTFNDPESPEVVNAKAVDAYTVHVTFSESLDSAQASNPANYTITPAGGVINLASLLSPGNTEVDLFLQDSLLPNVIYTVTVNNVQDCPLNTIAGNNEAEFGIPVAVDSGDIVLNELLFNPLTGGADYMEIYNQSHKIIDLSTLHIGEVNSADGDSVTNANEAAPECVLLLPQSYICLTKDKQFQLDTYDPIDPDAILEISDFPSYDDSEGEAIVYVPDYPNVGDTLVLDRFYYLDDYQFPNLDDDDGVSLERLSFSAETQNPDNWHSAASTVNYGTPGYQNSELLDPNPGDGSVTVNPETFSPDQDGTDDVLSINYDFDEAGWNARVTVFDPHGRKVRRLRENFLLPTEAGNLTWDGIDDNGKKAPIGVYVILFEASNPNTGKVSVFKVGCVLAAKL